MTSTLKDNTRQLFKKENIGTFWNDLYVDVKRCLDYHFILRLEASRETVNSLSEPGDRILDLGCGAGYLSEGLLEDGFMVDAADMSEDMLDFTRERLGRFSSRGGRIFVSECERIAADDGEYDTVACIGVFGYMDDVDASIRDIYRVLKPGGFLVMSIRNDNHRRVFDIFNWLRMLFYKLPRKVFMKLLGRADKAGHKERAGNENQGQQVQQNPHLINIWDRPKRVIRIFETGGFRLTDFQGLGYGPLTFRGGRLLPHGVDKFLSRMLSALFRMTGLQGLTRWYADISIYVFEKPAS